MKVEVSKENYDQVRQAEKVAGKKIKELKMIVPDCVNGNWGAYQIVRCYKTINKYYAEMKLLESAESEMDAHVKLMNIMSSFKAKSMNVVFTD